MRLMTTVLSAAFLAACGSEPKKKEGPDFLEPTIIRGTKVDPSKVKPVVIYTTGNSGCTGTFVSKDTFLTAAHCITNGTGSGSRYDGVTVRFNSCLHNPRYAGNSTADHAICKVIQGQLTEAVAAVVETDLNAMKIGDVVRQVGGGCSVWGRGGFGTMQWALMKIARVPKQDTVSSRDITTIGTPGSDTPGAPCSGDSGGALFATVRDANKNIIDALGKYLGVTSRSDTKTMGFFSSLVFSEDQAWLQTLEPRGYKVCGITASAEMCQPFGLPDPTPTPTPPAPTPTPLPPTPGPTPAPVPPSVNACEGALLGLQAKLFHKPYGDASAELALLAVCNKAPKPMPEIVKTAPYVVP